MKKKTYKKSFPLLPWPAQTTQVAQTVKFMSSDATYGATVYKTGSFALKSLRRRCCDGDGRVLESVQYLNYRYKGVQTYGRDICLRLWRANMVT